MADIRLERKSGGHMWLWILGAVLLVAAIVVALDWAGYIDLPFRLGSTGVDAPGHMVSGPPVHTQEG